MPIVVKIATIEQAINARLIMRSTALRALKSSVDAPEGKKTAYQRGANGKDSHHHI